MNLNNTIETLIQLEKDKLKQKRPNLKKIKFHYKKNFKGLFESTLHTRIKGKDIIVQDQSYSLQESIKKIFNILTRNIRRIENRRLIHNARGF